MTTVTYLKRNPIQAVEAGVTTIYIKTTIGASGAVSSSSGYGLTSVTKETTAGEYTILLDRKYKKLLAANPTIIQATTQGLSWVVATDSITSAGSIKMAFSVDAVATNPSSSTIILVAITVADSSLRGGVA
jgi:hypothetical protein